VTTTMLRAEDLRLRSAALERVKSDPSLIAVTRAKMERVYFGALARLRGDHVPILRRQYEEMLDELWPDFDSTWIQGVDFR
jgi:hypothetical protein